MDEPAEAKSQPTAWEAKEAEIKEEIELMLLMLKARDELKRVLQGSINYMRDHRVGEKFIQAFKSDLMVMIKELKL